VQSRVRLAEASLQRDSRLAEQGFVSHAQVQAQHEALLDLQIRERGAQRNLEVLRREARATEAETDSSQLQARTQQAQVDRTQATLEQEGTELSARNLVQLTASRNGVVGHIAAPVGQSLQAGHTVLSLLPVSTGHTGELQAELYAASRAAGFVESGQAVWLRLHAFPYQKFGMLPGEVTEVSRTPVLPQDLPGGLAQALLSAAQAQEPLYRITVALQANALQAFGRSQPLKAGMTLDADVIQDRRAIWEWVLEPLLAAKHRWQVSPPVGESESARPDNRGG
jgi:membrane fusion protein